MIKGDDFDGDLADGLANISENMVRIGVRLKRRPIGILIVETIERTRVWIGVDVEDGRAVAASQAVGQHDRFARHGRPIIPDLSDRFGVGIKDHVQDIARVGLMDRKGDVAVSAADRETIRDFTLTSSFGKPIRTSEPPEAF